MSADIYSDFASFYELYVGSWLADLPFYLDHARRARGPVLEVGAGSGRLTLPLAQAGVEITAVDVSTSMLARLRARLGEEPEPVRQRVHVIEGDVCGLRLGTRFPLIFVPFYTFNYLLAPEVRQRALARMKEHLAPGGRLIIDVFVPHKHIRSCPREPVLKVDTVDPHGGERIRGWVGYQMDLATQMETREHIFEITANDGQIRRTRFTTQRRYWFKTEMEQLLAGAGFVVETACTGYGATPADDQSEQVTFVAYQLGR